MADPFDATDAQTDTGSGGNPDMWRNLMQFGLATMAAGAQPGARTLGALGQGGMAAMESSRQNAQARSQQQLAQQETIGKKLQNAQSLLPLNMQRYAYGQEPIKIPGVMDLMPSMGDPGSQDGNAAAPGASSPPSNGTGYPWSPTSGSTTPSQQTISRPAQTADGTSSNASTLYPMIDAAAQKYGVPIPIARTIPALESSYNQQAVSPKGATGLMGLMPATAQELGVDPTDAAQNVDGGMRYFKQQLDRFGHPALALAAYNAGPQAVINANGDLTKLPQETQQYLQKADQVSTQFAQQMGVQQPVGAQGQPQQYDPRRLAQVGMTGIASSPEEAAAAMRYAFDPSARANLMKYATAGGIAGAEAAAKLPYDMQKERSNFQTIRGENSAIFDPLTGQIVAQGARPGVTPTGTKYIQPATAGGAGGAGAGGGAGAQTSATGIPGGATVTELSPEETETQKSFFGPEATEYKGAIAAKGHLAMMQNDLNELNQDPNFLSTGAGGSGRVTFAKRANEVSQQLFGTNIYDPDKVASAESLFKETGRLGFDMSKQLGAREPGVITQQAIKLNPGMDNTPQGAQLIKNTLDEAQQRIIDERAFKQQYYQQNGYHQTAAEQQFDTQFPPDVYAKRAMSTLKPIQVSAPGAVKSLLPGTVIQFPGANPKIIPQSMPPTAPGTQPSMQETQDNG